MPTSMALVSAPANTPATREKIIAVIGNPDLIVVTGFAVIGLLLSFGIIALLPDPNDLAVLSFQTP